MRLIKQPNNWSCTATAVSMLLDCKIEDIFNRVGHTGSEIIFPNLPDPAGRKGIHIQEIIDFVPLIPIEYEPWQTPNGVDKYPVYTDYKSRFYNHLNLEPGLIVGVAKDHWHTVAWDGKRVYDPQGSIYPFNDIKIDVQTFWKLNKCV